MFYVKAFLFKFVFVNLPHCDGQKRVNTAEPHDNLYMTVSRHTGLPVNKDFIQI